VGVLILAQDTKDTKGTEVRSCHVNTMLYVVSGFSRTWYTMNVASGFRLR